MTSLYSLRSTPKEGEYIVMKFDPDYEVESVYALSASLCVCPAGHRPTCRHRKMLPLFLAHHHVDDGWFLDWDTRLWRKPLGQVTDGYDGELADHLELPASTACATPGPQSKTEPHLDNALNTILKPGFGEATPMMDTIRTLAAEEEPSPATPPAAPAPAPEVSRSVGAGAPLKRRRITI